MQNLRLLVCDTCLDTPQPQLKPKILSPDPVPIRNPRPNNYERAYTAVTASYAMTSTDQIVNCTGSGGITITLPTAVFTAYATPTFPPDNVPAQGREISIINATTGNVTIVPQTNEVIDGALSYVIPKNYSLGLYADGTISLSVDPSGYVVDEFGSPVLDEFGSPIPSASITASWYKLPITPVTNG